MSLTRSLAVGALAVASAAAFAMPGVAAAKGTSVKVGPSQLGRILVDSHGRTLYLWAHDKGRTSTCNGQCAQFWPPLVANGKPTAGPGARAGLLGTSRRADRRVQVTYHGHPLYRFAGDKKPGDVKGEGLTGFGGRWDPVSAAGAAVRKATKSAYRSQATPLLAAAASVPTNTISTVAGGGRLTSVCNADYTDCHLDFGDGGPATGAFMALPWGVATTPDGGSVISDMNWSQVRRVSPTGTITRLAGTNRNGFAGDGGPATNAELNMPMGVAVQADGGVLIADSNNHRIRRVSPAGTITTVAGNGTEGFSGDGGAATAAELDLPVDVAATRDGGFLIADYGNNRIRRVSPAGTITTVAGSGAEGFSGDGGRATAARMGFPDSVSATADGGFLISDYEYNRVRRVSPTGTIATVAGSGGLGQGGFAGDGGPALGARFDSISDAVETPDGGLLISDTGNNRVRRVSPTGTVTTVAGSGGWLGGFSGDGGLATLAQLSGPSGLAVTANGGLEVADTSNHRVRFVDTDFRAAGA
jgi:predicted lipoprotein with Yx(FWY)xxD motif